MLRAVVFDLDGTITRPFLDFGEIRREIGVPPSQLSVLDQIAVLPAEERRRAWRVVEAHEARAAEYAELNEGVRELWDYLQATGLHTAVVTRNSERSTRRALEKLGVAPEQVITRDSGLPLKPDPAAIRHLLGEWRLAPREVLVVGDYRYDIQAGQAAGAWTCLVTNGRQITEDEAADFQVSSPGEVMAVLHHLGV